MLHANVDSINSVNLQSDLNTPHPLNTWEPYSVERQYHFLKVNLAQPLQVGANYTLLVGYSNTMNEGPMKRGIWWGKYTDASGIERYVKIPYCTRIGKLNLRGV